jgi:hypothetical protein
VIDRLVALPGALADLLPEKGIRRGSILAVEPQGAGCSLVLALLGEVTRTGAWAAAVGWPSLGLVAAAEMGVELGRLALVPEPGERWAEVVAALLDGFDMIVLRPPGRARPADARRLSTRARERGAVMVLLDAPFWPETPDIRLAAHHLVWEGLGAGHGRLLSRKVEVTADGRRLAGRERRRWVWLPGDGGALAPDEVRIPVATEREVG